MPAAELALAMAASADEPADAVGDVRKALHECVLPLTQSGPT
ncbi:hypothetical protein AB0I54_43275 [Streptomyces sp. NPDC050625]